MMSASLRLPVLSAALCLLPVASISQQAMPLGCSVGENTLPSLNRLQTRQTNWLVSGYHLDAPILSGDRGPPASRSRVSDIEVPFCLTCQKQCVNRYLLSWHFS